MTRFSLIPEGDAPLALVHVRDSLQFREKIKVLKPTGNSLLSPGVVRLGEESTGTLTLRLNKQSQAPLMGLVCGLSHIPQSLPQTEGLLYTDLETDPVEPTNLNLVRSFDNSHWILEDLLLTGFTLSGKRTEAMLLKLSLEGELPQPYSFGSDGIPAIPNEPFLFCLGREVSVDGEIITDLAAFSLSGEFGDEEKTHTLMIRRKDQYGTDFSAMRQRISVFITPTSRELYEKGQKVRFEITLDECIYRGEESFPDNKGIWGREFSYTVIGPVKIRVFRSILEDEGDAV